MRLSIWLLLALYLAFWPFTAHAAGGLTLGGACSNADDNSAHASITSMQYVRCTGGVWVLQAIQPGAATDTCAAAKAGQIQWTGAAIQYCDGSVWQTVSNSALYAGLMSATPTSASTGLSTWVNQGAATTTNSSKGLVLADSTNSGSNNVRLLCKAAPSTPYSIIGLFAYAAGTYNNPTWGGFAWRNTTSGAIAASAIFATASTWLVLNVNMNSATSWNGNLNAPASGPIVWIKLKNDGTTDTRYISMDGVTWVQTYTVALASSFLGSTGYNQVCLAMDNAGHGPNAVTLMSYQETSP